MNKLIERIDSASGPDREIEKAIYAALGNCNHERTEYYCIEDGNDCDSGHTCLDCGKDTYGAKEAPRYTASIDAAMTLVEPRYAPEVLRQAVRTLGKRFDLHMAFWPESESYTEWLARMICVEVLRAHEVRTKETSSGDD